ncbi:TetR/AcrR family transcriptional regulator [Mycobacterium sherrisii]|uniref:TetR/AcrR family transcriptional regulator n=1 Tax=Mycobacterium sherrisii TaxID=243061 RepID=UPI000A15A7D8|nr:TetR/AcrR family transcriptional regulator [Mycobacterium sherrisii]MCV7030800.1 TetR/AcrR family transcriptional regulator [Mycobacterium sherrisii]ORW77122.1 TetR family transcriptional regulator [Mycobacterium sherrisii]
MTVPNEQTANRVERRKQRTRAALIKAAQTFIAEGRLNVPVLDITQAADVGMGSFYNHFSSKDELFDAAVTDVLDAHGALLDALTAPIDDPAETFACSFRLTGRLFRRRPRESQIILNNGLALISSERGVAPRARRDLSAAIKAGRFTIADPDLALTIAGGVLIGAGVLIRDRPDRDDGVIADQVTQELLRLFGLPDREAHGICSKPLPDLDSLSKPDSAA